MPRAWCFVEACPFIPCKLISGCMLLSSRHDCFQSRAAPCSAHKHIQHTWIAAIEIHQPVMPSL